MPMQTSAVQFTLLGLFAGVTALCLVLAASLIMGAGAVIAFMVIAILAGMTACVWSALFAIAPDAVKYGTVLGSILLMAMCMLPMVLMRQREESRRLRCEFNVRHLQHEQQLGYRDRTLTGCGVQTTERKPREMLMQTSAVPFTQQ